MKAQGLYGLALQRLKECRTSREVIRFPEVFSKLCRGFSINKEKCWELLFLFRDIGMIDIVCGHGIRVLI